MVLSLVFPMRSGRFEFSFFVGLIRTRQEQPNDFSLQSAPKLKGEADQRHVTCVYSPSQSFSLSLSHLSWFAIQKFSAAVKWNVSRANPCNIIPSRSSVETTLTVNRGWPVSPYNSHIVLIHKKKTNLFDGSVSPPPRPAPSPPPPPGRRPCLCRRTLGWRAATLGN